MKQARQSKGVFFLFLKKISMLCILFLFLIVYSDFSSKKGGSFGGMFGMLKGLVGSKSLTREDMESVLDKMRDHLIGMMRQLSHTPFLLIFLLHLK